MDFFLHNHPIIPPGIPHVGGEGGDVHSWTLGPVQEVVAADGGRPLSGRSQHVEDLELVHR
jgi:hypothetical protein